MAISLERRIADLKRELEAEIADHLASAERDKRRIAELERERDDYRDALGRAEESTLEYAKHIADLERQLAEARDQLASFKELAPYLRGITKARAIVAEMEDSARFSSSRSASAALEEYARKFRGVLGDD